MDLDNLIKVEEMQYLYQKVKVRRLEEEGNESILL
jgi:hypothetical protein